MSARRNRRRHGKPGRPRLPPNEIRERRLGVRLTEEEYWTIRRNAEELGLPVTYYLRARGLNQRPRPRGYPKANLIYYDELNRLGNNLNQLLVLIYSNRAPLGLLSTLRRLQEAVEALKGSLLGCGATDRSSEEGDETHQE